jgi:glycosyltransferase involved in cell wall biosynthesis
MKISVLIPAFNEEESIQDTVSRVKKAIPHAEIIVINDGSKDNTGKILEKLNEIKVITNPYNLGYGASLKKGLREASGDYIAITDADGTYPIEDLPKLLKDIPKFDMVVGSRTGKNVHIPFFRKPAKWFIGKLANFMSGKKIPDLNSGLRVFDSQKAKEFMKLYPSGFSFTTTITLAFLTNDYTINFIPINYFKRKGKSTIHPIKDFIGFITLIFRIIMNFRPIRFFLVPGIFLILAGISYGVWQVLNLPQGLGEFPVLLFITGLQIVLMGFIADAVSKK